MTLNNATVSFYGGQIYTVRWQLKNITTLVPGECVNILKSYFKVRYLECLGQSAFILEFYIAFDIILICLIGDCFINKLKLRDPLSPLNTTPVEFYPSINVMWINLFVFPILIQFQTLLAHLTIWQHCTFLLVFLLIVGLFLCSIKFEHPKMHLKYLLKVIMYNYKISATCLCIYTKVNQVIHC